MICTCQSISSNVFDCPQHGAMLREKHAQSNLRDANRLIDRATELQNQGDHDDAEKLLRRAEVLIDIAEAFEAVA